MEIRCDAIIPFPRERVWSTYRDRLVELVPYLPNIRGIEVKSRKEEGQEVRLVNIWRGGGEIPAVARTVVKESMLSWTDYATWHSDRFVCEWRVEPHAVTEAVTSKGENNYTEVDGKTRLEIRGDLSIDATKIRGVPKFVGRKVGPVVEEFMVKLVSKNLLDVSASLSRFLRDEDK